MISDNTASVCGGVYFSGATFTMNSGEISGNTATTNYCGGVCLSGGTFTMNDGKISGNTTSTYGGGVSVSGTFSMNGGEISANTAGDDGGGVYVSSTSFKKQPASSSNTSGVIYGSDASPASKANTATRGSTYGHAVYVFSVYGIKKRDTTAGPTVSMDRSVDSSAWGWE